jgi:DnaJ-class molecular chaperone
MSKKIRVAEVILTPPNPIEDKPKKEKKEKKPHKCPVCEGKGLLRCGFYDVTADAIVAEELIEECKTCKGVGIVWSE